MFTLLQLQLKIKINNLKTDIFHFEYTEALGKQTLISKILQNISIF